MPKKRKVKTVGGGAAAAGGIEDKLGVGADKQDEMGKNDLPSTSRQQQHETGEEGCGVLCDGSFNEQVSSETGGRWDSDWTALLAIFPEEVWIIILESVPDADTLESLSNASPVFRHLLLPRRVQFLFPKVWNILGRKYHTADDDNYGDDSNSPSDPEDSDDSSTSSSSHTGVLKLRLVCRSWQDAIDNWYQNQPFRLNGILNLNDNHTQVGIDSLASDNFVSLLPDNLERFLPHFESTHCANGVAIRNPFLGRSVRLHIDLSEDEDGDDLAADQFLSLLRDMFLKYGHYIWYFEICFVDPGMDDMQECYSTLRTHLQAAPNLRTLCVSFESDDTIIGERDWLQPFVNLHPLPRLENLRLLATNSDPDSYMPKPVFRELIRTSGGNLSVLEFDHRHYSIGDYNISSVTVPNLSRLSVTIRSDEEFESFFKASNVQWRLSHLELELYYGTVSVEWDKIFREVERKWADTLTVLTITLPSVRVTENLNRLEHEGCNFRLNLPHLTHLKLDMPNLCSLDFLLPLSNSLEDLDLDVNATVQCLGRSGLVTRFENGNRIHLLSSPDKPMDSKMWTLFRKLNRVRLNYHLESGAKKRKDTLWWVSTVWSVTRQQWQNWDKTSDSERRRKLDMWEMKRIYHE